MAKLIPISPSEKVDREATFSEGIEGFRNLFVQTFDNSKVDGKGTLKSTASYIIDQNGDVKDIVTTGPNESLNAEIKNYCNNCCKEKMDSGSAKWQNVVSRYHFPVTMNFEGTKSYRKFNTTKALAFPELLLLKYINRPIVRNTETYVIFFPISYFCKEYLSHEFPDTIRIQTYRRPAPGN
nr:hypothetical protein [Elizabethkingia bruuniana]